ncbi:MAG TPA: hypothetical protein VGG16_03260 [Streptosporangiaceae bacterium]|jgi:hypothetical protein
MELSPARQKLLFVVIVVVLALLGYYLVLPATHHKNGTTASPPASSSPTSVTQPSPAQPASATPAVVPASTDSPAGGSVNIYDWLPFTKQNLIAAAQVATQFCVDYDTYTYTESASAYIGKMSSLTVSELASTLEEGYETPGTASLRTGQKQISSATAAIDNLRAFGQQSLTFVVTISQHLVSSKGTSNASPEFAVTLIGSGNSWQVSDVEPAAEGNS